MSKKNFFKLTGALLGYAKKIKNLEIEQIDDALNVILSIKAVKKGIRDEYNPQIKNHAEQLKNIAVQKAEEIQPLKEAETIILEKIADAEKTPAKKNAKKATSKLDK